MTVLGWKDVVMSVVYSVEVVRSIFSGYRHRRGCVVVIVHPIDMLARVRLFAEARPLDRRPKR